MTRLNYQAGCFLLKPIVYYPLMRRAARGDNV